jgi:imidazolonepropionase-like amidohydrolase
MRTAGLAAAQPSACQATHPSWRAQARIDDLQTSTNGGCRYTVDGVSASVLVCGAVFDGLSESLGGPAEILVRDGRISDIAQSVGRPDGADVIDLSERTVSPGFIDTQVHLTMDASRLAAQTLESTAAKALKGLSLAREYLSYGFTTLRDLGSMDPEFPTVDLRNALDAGVVQGPRLIVAAHIISASAGHGDLRGFYPRDGTFRSRRSPTAPRRSGGWSAASTPTDRIGSRRPMPAATSA